MSTEGGTPAAGGGWFDWFWNLLGYQTASPTNTEGSSPPAPSSESPASPPPASSSPSDTSAPPPKAAPIDKAEEAFSAPPPENASNANAGTARKPLGETQRLSDIELVRKDRPLAHSGRHRPLTIARRPSRAHLKQRKEMQSETQDEPKDVEASPSGSTSSASSSSPAPSPFRAAPGARKSPMGGMGMMPMFDPSAVKLKKTQPR